MMELFHPESKFMETLNKITDMMILNVLFILTSIPVITLGASATAMYTVTMRLSRQEDVSLMKEYFQAFRANLKKGTILWMILLLAGAVILGETWLLLILNLPIRSFLLLLQGGLILFYLSTLFFAFPLLAEGKGTVKDVLHEASAMPFQRFPEFLALMAIHLLPALFTGLLFPYIPNIFMIWGFVGFSVSAYMASLVLKRIFGEKAEE